MLGLVIEGITVKPGSAPGVGRIQNHNLESESELSVCSLENEF